MMGFVEYINRPAPFVVVDLQSLLTALYGNGEQGAFFVPKPEYLYQDAEGTALAAPGDPVGLMKDVSPNGNHLSQSVSGSRPVLVQDGDNYYLKLDKVDDNLSVSLPDAVNGTMLLATTEGIVHAHVDIPAGEWSITADPRYYPGDTLVGLILRDGHMNEQELQAAKDYLISIGAGADQFAGVGDMSQWFRSRDDLISLYTGDWDTSSVTNFRDFANGASSLTTVIVNGGTGNPFADSPCTNYIDAFTGTNLTQQSIDDILVAIEKVGTNNGTFDQSGGSAPSARGMAAVYALRARGWEITVTDEPSLAELIFAGGEEGALYIPEPQYLFQDAAGTTPVTADGDPVGLMLDLSGNDNHATQAVSGSRPVYRTDGNRHWLEFDGVDDLLYYPPPWEGFTAPAFITAACRSDIGGGTEPLFGIQYSPSASRFGILMASNWIGGVPYQRGGYSLSTGKGLSITAVRTVTATVEHLTARQDGVEVATRTADQEPVGTTRAGTLCVNGATRGAQTVFFGGVMAFAEPLPELVTAAERYLANLAGVALDD